MGEHQQWRQKRGTLPSVPRVLLEMLWVVPAAIPVIVVSGIFVGARGAYRRIKAKRKEK